MAALLYLLLAWLTGATLLRVLVGPIERWLNGASPLPVLLRLSSGAAAALWTGLLPVTVLTYALAWLTAWLDPGGIYPLMVANLVLAAGGLFLAVMTWRSRRISTRQQSGPAIAGIGRHRFEPADILVGLTLVGWLIFASWLIWHGFTIRWERLAAGFSVFSDFAPHTALVRSFAVGDNWPTTYPHFANDGIRYHFLFYFLCGNLNFLGLPLDWAINLPSILAFLSLTILLGTAATLITGRLAAYFLAPFLFFMRSSLAFFTFLRDLWQTTGRNLADWLPALLKQAAFIGDTPRDDWGLWAINVYANQRHFLAGLAVLILLILLYLPDLQRGLDSSRFWPSWRLAEGWLWPGWLRSAELQPDSSRSAELQPDSSRSAELRPGRWLLATLLLICLPYWHGSILIAALIIMAVMALFSRHRLVYIIPAGLAILSAMLQTRFFVGVQPSGSTIRLQFLYGFIAEDRSLPGLLIYLLQVTGLVLPLMLAYLFLASRLQRVLITAASCLLVLTFTISLTPDVTVNHKYLMIMLMIFAIFLADLLLRLWQGLARPASAAGKGWSASAAKGRQSTSDKTRLVHQVPGLVRRLAVVFLGIVLTITGLMEVLIYANINRNKVQIVLDSPLLTWIETQTAPRDVFVTAPYHYDSFFMSGRQVWLGHAYYAWSAGHDTEQRQAEETWLLAGGDLDPLALTTYARANRLRYLLLDDTLRTHPDFAVNEAFFRANFLLVAEFPDQGNTLIFDLQTLQGESNGGDDLPDGGEDGETAGTPSDLVDDENLG